MRRKPVQLSDQEVLDLLRLAENNARVVGCTKEEAEDVASECVKGLFDSELALEWPQMVTWVRTCAHRAAIKLRVRSERSSSLDIKDEAGRSWLDQLPMEAYEDREALEFVLFVLKQNVARCYGKCGCQELCLYLVWDAEQTPLREIARASQKTVTGAWLTRNKCRKLARENMKRN
jgi:DNA-directed RNA polymerase specialized sigma24 family protein